ncbi:MAG: Kae1-associated serine/threonine protein kinase, partial [Candidatus Altiarchaeota archaeon]|nr:Kae1-associated serine/threonine protein kinase [Candidatus Altiarchaeota archaeon]
MEEIAKGAEANLYLTDGLLVKKRVEKKYRHRTLDEELRRQRTNREAKNMERALKAGVNTPKVLSVDEKNNTLKMEYVEGRLLKELFDADEGVEQHSQKIGEQLRILHGANIIHNDLTTSNMIFSNGKIFFLDFGLSIHSTRLEDKAMDLVVFKKSIHATHTKQADTIWQNLLQGYQPDKQTITRIQTIEKRVRYK